MEEKRTTSAAGERVGQKGTRFWEVEGGIAACGHRRIDPDAGRAADFPGFNLTRHGV